MPTVISLQTSSQELTHAWNAGFQLLDGKERMIVVEGLADGAMQRMQDIALQALTGSMPQPNATCRRAVHWHKDLRSVLVEDENESPCCSQPSLEPEATHVSADIVH